VKTKTQIKTDRFVGVFIALMLNWIVRLLGFILHMDHSLDKKHKTIAVCKFKGMGSIIQSTPLLQTLKLSFPEARIVFVTTRANLGLLQKIPAVDEVICINDASFFKLIGSTAKALLAMWKLRIGVYLDLEIYSNFSSLITTLSLARNRVGFYRQASHYRMGIYTHMMYYNIKAPISKVYLQFAHLLNCSRTEERLYPLSVESYSTLFAQMNLVDQKYIVVNPNASDLRIERRWDKGNFVALIQKISETYSDYKIVLIGAESEKEYVGGISELFADNRQLIDLSGKTRLEELLYLLKNAALLITNDTGPMHLAFSLQTRTLALFGPCSPAQYGDNECCFVVYNNVYCSPCVHEFDIPPCKGNNQCMQTITVVQVYEAMRRALNQEHIAREFTHPIQYSGLNDEVLGVASR
jgi:ADP-heptose:LPS heptosyltransferase